MSLRDPLFTKRESTEAKAQASADTDTDTETVTAAHAYDQPDTCTACGRPMQDVIANGVPACACISCRVCMPKQDR